jgi:hypothetical protein
VRVLVGCEFSGTVRDAFTRAGHDAMSCDLLPTESPGPHYQGDVFDVLDKDWDLAIFHPPCTYLASAGNRWLYEHGEGRNGEPFGPARWEALIDGAVFFRRLLDAPIPRIAVENPGMNRHARQIIGSGPTQLPYKDRAKVHSAPPGPDRAKARSLFFTGIADAMAVQWGELP